MRIAHRAPCGRNRRSCRRAGGCGRCSMRCCARPRRFAPVPAGTGATSRAFLASVCAVWLGRRRKVEFPRLADQRGKLFLGDALGLHDHVRGLAPHVFDEGLGIGLEQKFLPLVGQMQIQPVGPDHREDALLGAKRRPREMIDLVDAVRAPARSCGRRHGVGIDAPSRTDSTRSLRC